MKVKIKIEQSNGEIWKLSSYVDGARMFAKLWSFFLFVSKNTRKEEVDFGRYADRI